MSLTEQAFDKVADQTLRSLEGWLGELDPDECEVDLSMGVLQLEFADGVTFVINSHRAARQIWLAGNAMGWRFSWDEATSSWRSERGGEELRSVLSSLVTEKLGHAIG